LFLPLSCRTGAGKILINTGLQPGARDDSDDRTVSTVCPHLREAVETAWLHKCHDFTGLKPGVNKNTLATDTVVLPWGFEMRESLERSIYGERTLRMVSSAPDLSYRRGWQVGEGLSSGPGHQHG
jgi:hypothetical protein